MDDRGAVNDCRGVLMAPLRENDRPPLDERGAENAPTPDPRLPLNPLRPMLLLRGAEKPLPRGADMPLLPPLLNERPPLNDRPPPMERPALNERPPPPPMERPPPTEPPRPPPPPPRPRPCANEESENPMMATSAANRPIHVRLLRRM